MKRSFIILYSGLVLVAAGCSKGYFDINQNPNQAVTVTPELVLPNALKVTADEQLFNGTFATPWSISSQWMNYWAASGSYALSATGLDTYKQTTTFGNGIWATHYRNLEDYDFVEKAAIANKSTFYEGASKIMKAYVFQQLVDIFNNVPYSEALQGTSKILPKYDDAKSIYESLSLKLDTAVKLMQRADAIGAATSDILFGGNNAKWIQLANTLKLRILMRQSEMSGRASYIKTEIAKITANGGGFLSADAGVNPGYLNSDGKQSPFWGFCYNTAGTFTQAFWRANKYPITFCKANNDPRYTFWYSPAQSGSYVGNVEGSAQNQPGNAASTFGTGVLKSINQPALVMTASESYFLQAEAALRGWLSGIDLVLVNQGIQASFSYLGAGDATSYFTQAGNKNTNYSACISFDEKLACIIRQKWEANNMTTPFEAWCDYRRLGLPADNPITVSSFVDIAVVPFRILYPSTEYQTNPDNVAAQGAIDHHTSKIFWMK